MTVSRAAADCGVPGQFLFLSLVHLCCDTACVTKPGNKCECEEALDTWLCLRVNYKTVSKTVK